MAIGSVVWVVAVVTCPDNVSLFFKTGGAQVWETGDDLECEVVVVGCELLHIRKHAGRWGSAVLGCPLGGWELGSNSIIHSGCWLAGDGVQCHLEFEGRQ